MPKTVGYMLTWTTYGTWLQGDPRNYVKNGKTLPPDEALQIRNIQNLKKGPVRLTPSQVKTVTDAIYQKAQQLNQKIYALSVTATHVHLIASYIPVPVGIVVRHYKNFSLVALRKIGFVGRVWTKGFDKRFCFDQDTLDKRINYVNRHNQKNI